MSGPDEIKDRPNVPYTHPTKPTDRFYSSLYQEERGGQAHHDEMRQRMGVPPRSEDRPEWVVNPITTTTTMPSASVDTAANDLEPVNDDDEEMVAAPLNMESKRKRRKASRVISDDESSDDESNGYESGDDESSGYESSDDAQMADNGDVAPAKLQRGRPKGSKNKTLAEKAKDLEKKKKKEKQRKGKKQEDNSTDDDYEM